MNHSASAVAGVILSKSPIAVLLVTLHIELMTQAHYTESVRDTAGIDALFASLLHHHWLEEAQHTKLDTLMVEELAAGMHPDAVGRAVDEYLELGAFVDGALQQQAQLDLESLQRAIDRRLPRACRARWVRGPLRVPCRIARNAPGHRRVRWRHVLPGVAVPA